MESVMAALKDTPIPTILVVAGVAFLLLSIAGQLAGRIAVAPERQRWAAIIGCVLLMAGVALYVVPQLGLTSFGTQGGSASRPPTERQGQRPEQRFQSTTSGRQTQPPPSPPRIPEPVQTGEHGPGTSITTAQFITEGTTVRGSLIPGQDRHFFQFKASSTNIRVILRKLSKGGFQAAVDVYDYHENRVARQAEGIVLIGGRQDQPISLSFQSNPSGLYYIAVTTLGSNARGEYELMVREE